MATHLQAGQKAPLFSAKTETGETISLKDFRAKKWCCIFTRKTIRPPARYKPATCATTMRI
jgi:peroxiredoxin